MSIKWFSSVWLTLALVACSSPIPPPTIAATERLFPPVEPISTEILVTPSAEPKSTPFSSPTRQPSPSAAVTHTVLRFEFPFEPSFPGYLVEVKSTELTASLMCALEQGKTTGHLIDLTQGTKDTKYWGICDTSSVILDILIPDQVTVTVILGGFPLVNEVTETPDSVTDQQAEYHFESSLK